MTSYTYGFRLRPSSSVSLANIRSAISTLAKAEVKFNALDGMRLVPYVDANGKMDGSYFCSLAIEPEPKREHTTHEAFHCAAGGDCPVCDPDPSAPPIEAGP